jgi:imidazolonepropionase-like amidohydrolase
MLSTMGTFRLLGAFLASILLLAAVGASLPVAPLSAPPTGAAEPNNPPANGPRITDSAWHAVTNVTVHVKPGTTLEHATVVVRDGRIVSVEGTPAAPKPEGAKDGSKDGVKDGAKPDKPQATDKPAPPEPAAPAAPAGSRVWDGTGLHVYPGMIDPYVEVDSPRPDPNEPGVHWNKRVTPQRRALDGPVDDGLSKRLRDMGFVAAQLVPKGGIFRGSSAVVSLAEPPTSRSGSRPPIYREDVMQAVAFDTGGFGGGGGDSQDRWDSYPDSQMGAIALVRQTLMDSQWRAQGKKALTGGDAALAKEAESMGFGEPAAIDILAKRDGGGGQRLMFVIDDELEILRAAKIAAEFKRPESVYVGTGTEFERLDAIKDRLKSGGWLVIPLGYPDDPKVDSIGGAADVELRTLMEWEQAPANPKRLNDAGIKFALTTGRIPDRRGGRGKFMENLRNAVRHGLPEDRAIALVTTEPAKLLGVEKDLGTVEAGKLASFVVTDGPLLDKKTKVRDVWIDGRRHEVNAAPTKLEGEYDVTVDPAPKAPGTLGMSIDKDNGITLKKTPPAAPAEEAKPADKPVDAKPGEVKPQDAKPGEPVKPVEADSVKSPQMSPEEKERKINELIDRIRALQADHKYDDAIKAADEILAIDPANQTGLLLKEMLSDPQLVAGFRDPANNDKAEKDDRADRPGRRDRRERSADKPKDDKAKDDKPKDKTARAKNAKIDGKAGTISFIFDHEPFGDAGVFTMSGAFERTTDGKGWLFRGEGTRADGTPFRWAATPKAPQPKKEEAKKDDDKKDDKDKKPDADKTADGAKDDGVSGTWSCKVTGGPIPPEGHTVTLTVKLADDGKVTVAISGPMGDASVSDSSFDKGTGTLKATVAVGQGPPGTMTCTLKGDALTGSSTVGGAELQISGSRTGKAEGLAKGDGKGGDEDDEDKPVTAPDLPGYPFGAYAIKELPPQTPVVITNATVWTCGPQGKVENGVVIASGGKIVYAGPGAGAPAAPAGATTIDAHGKHVTPGIIDCHSHTGISKGVNESGQAVTAEVRIQDVTNPDSMNWYRQLAGGTTCVNNLHGSANPIGGQNCINKVRWGVSDPDDMHFAGAGSYTDDNPLVPGAHKPLVMPGIKFALGENVKQSNWGDGNTTRYPQTRMGVETLIRDRFTAAKEYSAAWEAYSGSSASIPPRRDLELEALAQLLNHTRLIHCHSYRQDEILMLARLTRDFGFKLGTYQHNLEGYKVADVVKESSIGASIFSDWWAYKVEVQDAIPYAGAIMHDQGVVVSFNSDSDELARRLNYEAAKAVKYGGIKPEEALLFVTLNPAKQLMIDDHVGSLEAGKDADLVIWSGDPLSAFTRCEATFIDGRELYSLADDAKMRARDGAERQRLLQKALGAKKKSARPDGEGSTPPAGPGGNEDRPRRRRPVEEEVLADAARSGRSALIYTSVENAAAARREYFMSLLCKGINPEDAGKLPGDCGCGAATQYWQSSREE